MLCYQKFDVMCYKTCVCIEVSRTLSNINILTNTK